MPAVLLDLLEGLQALQPFAADADACVIGTARTHHCERFDGGLMRTNEYEFQYGGYVSGALA